MNSGGRDAENWEPGRQAVSWKEGWWGLGWLGKDVKLEGAHRAEKRSRQDPGDLRVIRAVKRIRLQLENFAFMTQGTSRRCREVPGTAQVSAGKHQGCRAQQWGFFFFFGQTISWTLKLPKLWECVQDVSDEIRGGLMAWLHFCWELEELVGRSSG